MAHASTVSGSASPQMWGKDILDLLLEAVNQLPVGLDESLLGFEFPDNLVLCGDVVWHGDRDAVQCLLIKLGLC